MYASTTAGIAVQRERNATQAWGRALLLSALWVAITFFLLPGIAHATGGSDAAQARINDVALGWQEIITGVGIFVLIVAWSWIGYMIAFGGKTAKDMFPVILGSSIAGLAPVLVAWMFS
jgi:hypothetical protein